MKYDGYQMTSVFCLSGAKTKFEIRSGFRENIRNMKRPESAGTHLPGREMKDAEPVNENCQFISNSFLEYLKKEDKLEDIYIYGMGAHEFIMMDMDAVMEKVHTVADGKICSNPFEYDSEGYQSGSKMEF